MHRKAVNTTQEQYGQALPSDLPQYNYQHDQEYSVSKIQKKQILLKKLVVQINPLLQYTDEMEQYLLKVFLNQYRLDYYFLVREAPKYEVQQDQELKKELNNAS